MWLDFRLFWANESVMEHIHRRHANATDLNPSFIVQKKWIWSPDLEIGNSITEKRKIGWDIIELNRSTICNLSALHQLRDFFSRPSDSRSPLNCGGNNAQTHGSSFILTISKSCVTVFLFHWKSSRYDNLKIY